jgi:hypothetical protein
MNQYGRYSGCLDDVPNNPRWQRLFASIGQPAFHSSEATMRRQRSDLLKEMAE